MYIKDGIAYAGTETKPLKICGVRPMANHRLWIRFSNGEEKIYDCTPLLQLPAFAPLAEEAAFRDVYIDFGMVVWQDGGIDIATEELYQNGAAVKRTEIA